MGRGLTNLLVRVSDNANRHSVEVFGAGAYLDTGTDATLMIVERFRGLGLAPGFLLESQRLLGRFGPAKSYTVAGYLTYLGAHRLDIQHAIAEGVSVPMEVIADHAQPPALQVHPRPGTVAAARIPGAIVFHSELERFLVDTGVPIRAKEPILSRREAKRVVAKAHARSPVMGRFVEAMLEWEDEDAAFIRPDCTPRALAEFYSRFLEELDPRYISVGSPKSWLARSVRAP